MWGESKGKCSVPPLKLTINNQHDASEPSLQGANSSFET